MSSSLTPNQNASARRVLLVEDSEDDAFFFERTVKKCALNLQLRRAINGSEAIQVLSTPNGGALPELIFLDLKMPIVSGFDVLRWASGAKLTPAPKIIVLSGSNDSRDRLRAAELGATDYLVKPITPADLHRCLTHLAPGAAQPASPNL